MKIGAWTVYPVSTPRGVTDLCQHHLNVHQSISAGSNDLAGHLGIPQVPSEPLGASKTGTCADCHKNTDYMLKLQRPEGFDRQQQRDSQQPRTRRSGPYVPAKTKPLTPLRQSENAGSGRSDNEIRRSRNGSSSFLRDETTNSVVQGGSNRRAPGPALDHLRGSTFSQVSRPVSSQRSGMSVKKEDRMKKLPTLRMLAHDATENQELHYDSAMTPIHKHAHDATENQELRHCPFCGAGKIIGRQDGSVECEFCFAGETEFVTWDGIKTLKETVGTVQRVLTSPSFSTQIAKGRSRRGNCLLVDAQVIQMRDLYAEGVTKAELARRFDVTQNTVKKIVERQSWRHLGGGGHAAGDAPTQEAIWGQGHSVFGGVWVDAEIKSFGTQPLLRVTLSRNGVEKIVHATAGHRWYVHPSHGTAFKTDQKKISTTDELQPGYRLAALYPKDRLRQNKPTIPSPFGIAHGFTFGDGSLTGRGGANVVLWGEKDRALLPYFTASRQRSLVSKNNVPGIEIKDLPAFFKELPPKGESLSYLYGWLAGYFAADGSVGMAGSASLACADRGVLEEVQALCTRLGIATFGITGAARLGFGDDLSMLWTLSFVVQTLTEDFFLIPEHRARFLQRGGNAPGVGWTVVSVEETDRVEEVYCAVVPDHHNFTLAGDINVMNCHQFFTVQVQPQFPNFPQTIDGQPQQIPGMPGQVETPPGASVPGGGLPPGQDPSQDPAEGGNPFGDAEPDADDAGGPPDGDADDQGGDEPPPFAKKSFKTVTGALLDEENYARHLAIRLSPDRDAMIALIRQEQGAS